MIRQKLFNSTLHNISKKKAAQIDAGEIKYAGIRKASKAAASRWIQTRKECLKRWGRIDALTLEPIPEGETVAIHHFCFTRAQSPKDRDNQLNLCPMRDKDHRKHRGADILFYQWREIIKANAKILGLETL